MPKHDIRLDPRLAGRLTRYHTWSRIHDQNVGEHQWQVTRILLALLPEGTEASVECRLVRHTLFHDIGEMRSGDAPYPLKAHNPALKKMLDDVERDAHLSMTMPWHIPPPVPLSHNERIICKVADLLDMLEWGMHEIEMGSKHAVLVAIRCHNALKTLREEIVNANDAWMNKVLFLFDTYLRKRTNQHRYMMESNYDFTVRVS